MRNCKGPKHNYRCANCGESLSGHDKLCDYCAEKRAAEYAVYNDELTAIEFQERYGCSPEGK